MLFRSLQQQLTHHVQMRLSQARIRWQDLAAHPGFRRLEDLLRQRRQQLDDLGARLGESLGQRLLRVRQRFTLAQARVFAFDLRAKIAASHARLEQRLGELDASFRRFLVGKRRGLERLVLQLDERSPLRVLERGYAIVYDAAGNVVRAAEQVALGETVAVQLAKGRLAAEVKRKEEK